MTCCFYHHHKYLSSGISLLFGKTTTISVSRNMNVHIILGLVLSVFALSSIMLWDCNKYSSWYNFKLHNLKSAAFVAIFVFLLVFLIRLDSCHRIGCDASTASARVPPALFFEFWSLEWKRKSFNYNNFKQRYINYKYINLWIPVIEILEWISIRIEIFFM